MTSNPERTGTRLLVINPNSNPAVTEQVRLAAEACAGPLTRLAVTSPSAGPFAIETAADRAAAIPHVLELIAAHGNRCDGYVLACFDDIAIAEARLRRDAPVISMAEAGIRAAAASHPRFAVVTTVAAAVPTIQALIVAYGLAGRCSVRATGIGVAETAARSPRAERALSDTIALCRADDAAEAIVLGSGAYAGRRADLSASSGLPVIDGLEAAIAFCEAGRHRATG